jgi:hypothetical protein
VTGAIGGGDHGRIVGELLDRHLVGLWSGPDGRGIGLFSHADLPTVQRGRIGTGEFSMSILRSIPCTVAIRAFGGAIGTCSSQ